MMKRNFSFVLLLLGATLSLPACAGLASYSADPIESWIVDADTKQPLEGVVVIAHWRLESTSRFIPHQTNEAGSLMILETVTDAKGRFYFPAWGPKLHLGQGDLTDSDPELLFFKGGYKYLRLSNSQYLRPKKYSDVGKPSGTESKPSGSKRISFWSGETIALETFKGSVEEYAGNLSFFMTNLRFIEDDCRWKQTPKMVLALQRQSEVFKTVGITRAFYSVDYLPTDETKCGSPKEFFRNFKP